MLQRKQKYNLCVKRLPADHLALTMSSYMLVPKVFPEAVDLRQKMLKLIIMDYFHNVKITE